MMLKLNGLENNRTFSAFLLECKFLKLNTKYRRHLTKYNDYLLRREDTLQKNFLH